MYHEAVANPDPGRGWRRLALRLPPRPGADRRGRGLRGHDPSGGQARRRVAGLGPVGSDPFGGRQWLARPRPCRSSSPPGGGAGGSPPPPGLEVLAGSWRSEAGTSAAAVEADSFAPRRWPELLLPRLYGRPSPALPGGFWAASSFPWQRYLLDLHLGSIPLLLLLLSRRRKEARPWLLAAGVLVLLAAFPPLLLVLRRWLPFLRLLRFAIKCLIPAAVVLAPAVALGARTALERPGSFRKGALVLALPLLLLLVPALWPGLLRTLLGGIFPASAANLALPGVCRAVARDLRLDLVVALFPLAAAAWSPRPRAPRGGPGRFPTLASQHRGRYPPPDPAGQRVSARCPYAARPSPDPGLREQRPVPAGVGPLPSRAPDHGSAGGGSSHSGPSDSQRCGGAHTPGQPTGAVTVSRAARHQ